MLSHYMYGTEAHNIPYITYEPRLFCLFGVHLTYWVCDERNNKKEKKNKTKQNKTKQTNKTKKIASKLLENISFQFFVMFR